MPRPRGRLLPRSPSSASAPRARARSGPSRPASTPRSTPPTCAPGCSASPRTPITSARPGTRSNAEFMAGLFRSWGYQTRDRAVQGPLPDAQDAPAGDGGAHPLQGEPRRAARAGGLHLRPDRGAAPALQRLLDRRRRHRRAGLRQLRGAQGLRGAGAAGDRRQGEDRDRALRRLVARHQAQGGRRARRHRLPHLLRSARRRLLPGRRLSQGGLPQREQRPARLGGGHAALLGRSADAGHRRHRGRQAARRQGRADDHQDPRAPHLLRRRPAAAQGAGRPHGSRGLARRAAHPLSPRRRPHPRPPQAGVQLGPEADLRRHRPAPRLRAAGRVGDPRQPPRRLGQRRLGPGERPGGRAGGGPGGGRAREERLEAEAHPHLRRLGRRGAGPAGLHRVGRDPRRRAARSRRRLHQLGRQLPRLLQRRRLAHAGDLRQPGGPRRHRSREGDQRPRPLRSPARS